MLFWVMHITTGGLPQGLYTLESEGYIIFHIIAEIIMGTASIVGGVSLIVGVVWGIPVGLVANGMLAYTGINCLAWRAVKQNHMWIVVFCLVTIVAFINISLLLTSLLTM
jgi:hypothetical protein